MCAMHATASWDRQLYASCLQGCSNSGAHCCQRVSPTTTTAHVVVAVTTTAVGCGCSRPTQTTPITSSSTHRGWWHVQHHSTTHSSTTTSSCQAKLGAQATQQAG